MHSIVGGRLSGMLENQLAVVYRRLVVDDEGVPELAVELPALQ